MNIGLTGGMGCGKSTALAVFAAEGAVVMDADAEAKRFLDEDIPLQSALVDRFGREVLTAEGKVDRRFLASTVFANPEALAALESLVHPRVRSRWMQEAAQGHPVFVVEIPLLFEKSLESHFDHTVCLSSHPEIQRTRLLARGMNLSEIKKRSERQLSIEAKCRRADTVLHNDGDREHLKHQICYLLSQLRGFHP
jgi:dephospho-CoA kinase